MQFGVMELFQQRDTKAPAAVLEDAIELAVRAEELGFDGIWLAEHHFTTYGIVGNPLLLAAAIAQRTERIKIGMAVLVLPFYDPIRLAEDIALVDHLSKGRLQIGIGRGYQPTEFRGLGVDQSKSREIADEVAAILRSAWTDEKVTFHGEHFHYDDVAVVPKPYQSPHPRLFEAAVSLSSFERAGREGTAILTSPNFTPLETVRKQFHIYRTALAESGHDVEEYILPLMEQVYIGADEHDAYETPRENAMWYQALLATLVPGSDGKAPSGYEQWDRISENMRHVSYDDVFNGANYSTTEQAIERLRAFQELGVNYYIGWFGVGGLDHDIATKSMERFSQDVMPLFR